MRVLVSAASRHGATEEIAREIATALAEAGLEPVLVAPDQVASLEGFDAVILGSAIYMGQWMDSARHLVDRLGPGLATRPVWLFSSGPAGDRPPSEEEPVEIGDLVEAVHAREHRLFAGRVDPRQLGLGERTLLQADRTPEGDFRPWPEIRDWAAGIAASLRGGAAPSS